MATRIEATNATSDVTERFGKSVNSALVDIGEKFGIYSALAAIGPSTVDDVAGQTGIRAAEIGHWLEEQAAAGYLEYDQATHRFSTWCEIGRN
jgi:hypothetical protein